MNVLGSRFRLASLHDLFQTQLKALRGVQDYEEVVSCRIIMMAVDAHLTDRPGGILIIAAMLFDNLE